MLTGCLRTTGRRDYLRIYEVEPHGVATEFASNIEQHAADLATLVSEPGHVPVLAGRKRADQLSELGVRQWEPLRDWVCAVCMSKA